VALDGRRVHYYLLAETEVTADEAEGHRDAKPQEQQREKSPKWHGTRRALAPHKEIQDEEHHEHDTREEKSRLHRRMPNALQRSGRNSHARKEGPRSNGLVHCSRAQAGPVESLTMSVFRFHASPLKDLYNRDDTLPAKILR